ncbi:hypothetical protein MPNT_20007 [Candidatus Methylacidithermus pantelleriae]|uniref:Uncharacterized protein n=1 Tax=Candidatus Methylacidithermus pantelleriae TaxID=2744239 RepID=A0A8J2FVU2_9BACT|nr:hypothetical protein MPNT_20007 [Candidatus Methylacidithermus pantelleriae]
MLEDCVRSFEPGSNLWVVILKVTKDVRISGR